MKIEVKNVTKEFNHTKVLEDINIEFNEGKIIGLIGRNGSGKSVLLKMLCAYYAPSKGEILYDGINIINEKKFPPSTRALIETPVFLPELSGFDNLKMLSEIQNIITNKEIYNAIDLVNLTNDKDKKYLFYSLGMKQKLGLAQVFMEDPKVIILDEPFNSLDNVTIDKIRKYLNKIKKDKIIIIATHIKEDINQLCDDIYELDNCKLNRIIK